MKNQIQFGRPFVLHFFVLALMIRGASAQDGTVSDLGLKTEGFSKEVQEAFSLINEDSISRKRIGFVRLEALRDPAVLPVIKKFLKDSEEEMRASAVRVLAAIEGPQATETLSEILKSDESAQVRLSAVLALEPLKDPKLLPVIIQAMEDKNPQVRMAAVEAASRINEPNALEALILRDRKEQNKDVRRVIQDAIKRIQGS